MVKYKFDNAAVNTLTHKGELLLRKVSFALRDRNWGTVPLVITGPTTAESRINGRPIITWQYGLETTQNSLTFTLRGTVRESFPTNRAGFYLLLPPAATVGRPATAYHPGGSTTEGQFPRLIAPHQPFKNLAGFAWTTPGGQRVDLAFSGEVFEMEDERNWTDDNFKIYCTPLERPFPVMLRPGAVICQEVSIALNVKSDRGGPPPSGAGGPATPVGRSPRLHTCFPLDRQPDRLPNLAGYRWDATVEREPLHNPPEGLHLALLLKDDWHEELDRLLEMYGDTQPYAVSVACLDRPMVDEEFLGAALPLLRAAFPEAKVGFGSAFYFTELNRHPPQDSGSYDFVYFGNAGLVHAFDDASLMRTIAGQVATVESARALYPGLDVWVSPLTLYPRFNPNRTDGTAAALNYAHPPDPRQHSEFLAEWTRRCLLALGAAEASTVEWFETEGPRGLLRDGKLSPAGKVLRSYYTGDL